MPTRRLYTGYKILNNLVVADHCITQNPRPKLQTTTCSWWTRKPIVPHDKKYLYVSRFIPFNLLSCFILLPKKELVRLQFATSKSLKISRIMCICRRTLTGFFPSSTYFASPQTSSGLRLSPIYFSPTNPKGRLRGGQYLLTQIKKSITFFPVIESGPKC